MPRRRITKEDRKFGVELEFTIRDPRLLGLTLGLAARERGYPFVDRASYGVSEGYHWELKLDRSCGSELASPALNWSAWSQVPYMVSVVEKAGATVNASCGVHVHHEMLDLTRRGTSRRLYALWLVFEPLAFAMCDMSRYGNPYCTPMNMGMDLEDFQRKFNTITGLRRLRAEARALGRHASINFLPYWRTGTIEFRAYHGTLATDRIKWWVQFTQTLVDLSTYGIQRRTLERLIGVPVADLQSEFSRLVNRFSRQYPASEMLAGLERNLINPAVFEHVETARKDRVAAKLYARQLQAARAARVQPILTEEQAARWATVSEILNSYDLRMNNHSSSEPAWEVYDPNQLRTS